MSSQNAHHIAGAVDTNSGIPPFLDRTSTTCRAASAPTPPVEPVAKRPITRIRRNSADMVDPVNHPTSEATIIAEGVTAWRNLKPATEQIRSEWWKVGKALVAGRTEVMHTAGVNKPVGGKFNKMFGAWLNKYGFDDIDKGVRSHLIALVTDPGAESWLSTLTATQRLEYNHPNTIFRHYKRATVVPKPKPEGYLSPKEKLEQSIVALEEENAALKRQGNGHQYVVSYLNSQSWDDANEADRSRFAKAIGLEQFEQALNLVTERRKHDHR